ncbi:MAG: SPOR domain-containing protein [Paracoccaceae bacterium]
MGKIFEFRKTHYVLLCTVALVLAGCTEDGKFSMDALKKKPDAADEATEPQTAKGTERDVEAPEVFEANEAGLWDGRPSLGGVWVAHPDVTEPERVIITNTANNKSVVGALFRREREIPGPRLQISSDAAAELGMLAGAPSQLSVIALRREIVPEPAPAEELAEAESVDAPAEVTETTLDPIDAAAAAIDASEPAPAPNVDAATVAATTPTPEPAPAPKKSSLSKPFIQVGIFSVEENAQRTATQIRSAGMVPTVKAQTSSDKPFWRVIVGPASNRSERKQLLSKIKAEGFSDAYAVSN